MTKVNTMVLRQRFGMLSATRLPDRVNRVAGLPTTSLKAQTMSIWRFQAAQAAGTAWVSCGPRMVASLLLLWGCATTLTAEEATVDFRNDLVPVFTKVGCNAGACHGAALGRGGFKLSLYGGNPLADYDAIVRQREGRRINLVDPTESLLLQKPTESIAHGGGFLFDFGDEASDRFLKWIQQGANYQSTKTLKHVEFSPRQLVTSLDQPTSLRATAHYADGTFEDVTRWTIFKAEDASAVSIDVPTAETRVRRRGRHIVVARFLNQVVPIELVVPLNEARPDFADAPRWNFIDDEILTTLEALRLPVSPLLDDNAFLRRVTLDLTGRLPTQAAIERQLGSDPPSRAQIVDELLASEEFNEYWTLQLAKLLRIQPQGDGSMTAATTYNNWLKDQLKTRAGYDQLARDVILASGDTESVGPANFYRTVDGPREQAEFMSELFMGSRLRCANCHNHPLDRWTQDDYHGLAAIFARLQTGRVINPKPDGQVLHPRTLEKALCRIPGEYFLEDDAGDARQALADWLTDADNPYFAKAIVNRLWKTMLGRGLVEPADDFRATNPATHPALLDQLAADFQANGYRLRHTLRLIANSATYARSANALADNRDDDRFYSHAIRKPLEPEILADAISDVLGVAETYGANEIGTRAVSLVDPRTPSRTLDVLGRCGRESSCESAPVSGGLPQKLHLLNGELLNGRLASQNGRLEKLLADNVPPLQIIEAFYRTAFARSPNEQEQQYWTGQVASLETDAERKLFLQDFVWGVLTSEEFVTNH